jgi:hypothetical protein
MTDERAGDVPPNVQRQRTRRAIANAAPQERPDAPARQIATNVVS